MATLIATGCGTNAVAPISPQTQTAPAFVIGTDAPLPSVTSFAVQIQSINATTADGTSVPLISGTPTVDFARFNGLQTLIDMNDVPVGTYTGITVTLGSATLGYLNVAPNTAPTIATEAATLTSSTVTKTLTNPLVVTTSGPIGLRMDFDLRKSVQVDSNNQITGTVTPTLDLKVVDPSDSGAYVDQFDAAVLSVNANAQSFTIQGPHGHQFTVNVNGQTMWDNNESLSDLSTSSIVEISGTLDRADSTFDADEVSILSQDGFYAGGLMTYVNPSSGPATDFQFYVHGTLPASTGVTLGTIAQVNLTGNETFFIHRAHGPLAQFLFNPSTLLPGQHITVGGPASGATKEQALTVKRVTLRQRGYNATVVSGSVNPATQTFQIQVNDFAGLLIPQTVTVYVEPNTSFRGGLNSITDVQSGATVRVVGLLIKDPTSGDTMLLARYVDELD
jgi:hypothetical protein